MVNAVDERGGERWCGVPTRASSRRMLKLRGSATETEEDAEAAAATAAEVYRRKLKPKAKSKQICEQFIIFQFQALSFRRCQHGFDRDNQHRPTEEEEGEAVAAAPVCGVTMASPDEGMNCPVSILKVVVFPAPFTPRCSGAS